MSNHSNHTENENSSKEGQLQQMIYKTQLPSWMKYILLFVAVLFLIAVICTTIYRYTLIGKALNSKEYTTALALSSPEIGTGIGYFTSSFF